jgi:pSer/pThr/pTyr-binding forkhead associated (FHA) protein
MTNEGSIESTSLQLGEKTPGAGAGGQEPAELLVIEGQNRGERVVLGCPITGIGRRSENRLVLSSKGVSRFHCQVIRGEGRYSIEDLNSLHGTFQNGRRLSPRKPQPLRHGDRLRILDQVILFHHPGDEGKRDGLASIRLDPGKVAAEASEILKEMPGLKARVE